MPTVAAGSEVVVTAKLTTVSVKTWVAFVPTPFEAVRSTWNVPFFFGTPEIFPLLKVTPLGRVPHSRIVAAGEPLAVAVKLPNSFWENVAESAEVNEGASLTVSENDWSAATPTPLIALTVTG